MLKILENNGTEEVGLVAPTSVQYQGLGTLECSLSRLREDLELL